MPNLAPDLLTHRHSNSQLLAASIVSEILARLAKLCLSCLITLTCTLLRATS